MAGIIPQRVIDEILFRTDIVDLVGSFITLHRAGTNFKGLCPFHREKTPSFIVNPQRQSYKCFGCGEGGNVIGFLMKQQNMEFLAAVRMLAQRSGIELEVEEDDGRGRGRKQLLQVHSEVAAKYHSTLRRSPAAAAARRYLEERGLDAATVEAFQLGYAPDRWDAVLTWGARKGYSADVLEEAGLVLRKTTEDGRTRYYDRFRNRLMFPISDAQGRVVAFSARALDPGDQSAKYINSPETPIFQKGRVLYALDKARKAIIDAQEALICEGQIDVIRCHQAGFHTAVASQGTAFTDDHGRIIKRNADSVVLVFDGDTAGQEASIKTARVCLSAGLSVRIGVLPAGEDPDSFIRRHGADGFRAVLDAARPVVAFQVAMLSQRETGSGEVKTMRMARDVLKTITHCTSPIQKATMLREAAQCLALPESALEEELRQIPPPEPPRPAAPPARAAFAGGRSPASPAEAAAAAPTTPPDRGSPDAEDEGEEVAPVAPKPPDDECYLCEHIAQATHDAETIQLVRRNLPLQLFSHPLARRLAGALLAGADRELPPDEAVQQHLAETPEEPASAETFRAFAAARLHATSRIRGIRTGKDSVHPVEASHYHAVQDLIRGLWIRRLKQEHGALLRRASDLTLDETHRLHQLRQDLESLKTWKTGAEVIEMELATGQYA